MSTCAAARLLAPYPIPAHCHPVAPLCLVAERTGCLLLWRLPLISSEWTLHLRFAFEALFPPPPSFSGKTTFCGVVALLLKGYLSTSSSRPVTMPFVTEVRVISNPSAFYYQTKCFDLKPFGNSSPRNSVIDGLKIFQTL